MKKIWTWVAILLLLIIFCVWSKNENIYLHIRNTPQTLATPKTVHDSERIAFVLREEEGGSSLNGRFSSIAQQNSLSNTCNAASTELIIQDVSIDKSLAGDEIIELTNSILPHFLAHYKQGAITYQHQVLKISGIADSFASQREMQRLLAMSMLPTQDNSSVAVTKPIDFSITKDLQSVQAEGVLGNKDEIQTLSSLLPDTASINFTQGENRIDHGAVAVSEKILPFFMGHYTHGKIAYKEGVLNISGMVESEEDIAQMKQLLSAADIPFVNHTIIDKEALAKRQAEAERLRKELEEKQKLEARKKQAEEKATRAQKEQRLQEEAKQQTEALRREKEKQTKETVKEKITQLLKLDNIEFETGQGALTTKGKETVDKLFTILQTYPTIRAEIAGHTDSDGDAAFNLALSQKRVDAVKKRLVAEGIDENRLIAKGYGETQPLVPNTTDENKQKNRRVEINILGE